MTESQHDADIVLTNGTIYTLDDEDRFVTTLAIKDDNITYVGDPDDVSSLAGPDTRVIDVDGHAVLPGFCDAHCHALMGGRLMNGCLLTGASSKQEYVKTIQAYAQEHQDASHIFGFGWIHSPFPSCGPRKETLDDILPDIPAYFLSIDYHSCWVNTKALDVAGITKQTADPDGGHIERHPGTAEPWGCLREMPAIRLVTTRLPQPTKKDWKQALKTYMRKAAQHGITSVFDAGVLNTDQWNAFQAVKEMDDNGELTIRLHGSYVCDPSQGIKQISDMLRARETVGHGTRYKLGVAKIFMDGAVEGHTGFLLESYKDRENYRGSPVWSPDEYKHIAAALDKHDVQIHVHSIGGGATREALDGLVHAAEQNGGRDTRHTLAHLEIVSETDIQRFPKLGVIACFQPAWFYMDENYYDETIPLMGRTRADRRYLIEDFIHKGAMVSFGSDWPWGTVSSTMNPLIAVGTAVTRKDPDDSTEQSYEPRQRMDLKRAIRCHCSGGAIQNFMEDTVGTLEPGKKADIVVLDQNIFEKPAAGIDTAAVAMTIFNGTIVYRQDAT